MTEKHHRRDSELTADGRTLVVTLPFKVKQRGGRRLLVMPEGSNAWAPALPKIDNTLLRALARAHRWKRMLERGEYSTIRDIERTERCTNSFVSRLLKLTLLAPDIIEAILDGRQALSLQLEKLAYQLPTYWPDQRTLARH